MEKYSWVRESKISTKIIFWDRIVYTVRRSFADEYSCDFRLPPPALVWLARRIVLTVLDERRTRSNKVGEKAYQQSFSERVLFR